MKHLGSEMKRKLETEKTAFRKRNGGSTVPLVSELHQFYRRCEPFPGYGFVDENGDTQHLDKVPADSIDGCETQCLENAVCEAWTYNKKEKICYMKDAEMSNSLGDTWDNDVVSVRMESCLFQVDICSVVMDDEILVTSNFDYMREASILLLNDFKGLASYCKAKTTFTFHFSILTLSSAFLSILKEK